MVHRSRYLSIDHTVALPDCRTNAKFAPGCGKHKVNTYIRDLKIAVYGKRLTSRNSFIIKSKSWTVKCSSHTIYYRNLKCCSKTPCMTTKTLSLMGNSLGHPSLDVQVDVRRLQWTAMSLSSRSIVKCKRQTAQVKRQAMWAENHLISTAKFL